MQPKTKVVAIDRGGHRDRMLARRDELVESHLDLVRSIAITVSRKLPPCFALDDLVAAGNMALTKAATSYRPGAHNDTPFSAYARQAIRGAMLDTARRRNWDESTRPGLEDAAEPSARPDIEVCIDSARLRKRVIEAVGKLPARERAILIEYYSASEPSLRAVGERIGVSARRAAQLHESAIDELRELLRSA